MCGIVGLLVKKPELHGQLGALMMPMLIGMTERGPDSMGLAVFTEPLTGIQRKYSVYSGLSENCDRYNWAAVAMALERTVETMVVRIHVQRNHAVIIAPVQPAIFREWLSINFPDLLILSSGSAIDLYKDVGRPIEVATHYGFHALKGSHLVAHTCMATESAVTPNRASPFSAVEDFCVVHNGSLSNANTIRRKLQPLGINFETDSDTEAACRFIEWRIREGDDLEAALHQAFQALDGFYTWLVGTADKLSLVRDSFAYQPVVVAETEDYVAIASEFRSLAHLPGIKNANVFEPTPEEMYVWTI